MTNLEQKISQAKARLLVNYPLFGTLASKVELVKNDDIQSFKSNGIRLEYNDEFFEALEVTEMEFVFANSAMHSSLAHEARQNGRSGWLWQLATDYAINDMLVQNGLSCPHGANYSQRFGGMYAEEVYAILKEDILRDELEYEADEKDDIQNDDSQEERLFEEEAKAIIDSEIKSGEIPDSIERFFDIGGHGKIDWRNELRYAIERFYKDDYVLMPPSKKFLHLGIYLPSCISQRFKLVVAVDSSGSVNEELLNEFLSELDLLMNTLPNYRIDLLVCDDKIRSHKIFYNGDILEAQIRGGGATDFRPVFEFVENELEDVRQLLYFTDIEGVFPNEAPSYDVKWISPKESEVPFGEVIVLQD